MYFHVEEKEAEQESWHVWTFWNALLHSTTITAQHARSKLTLGGIRNNFGNISEPILQMATLGIILAMQLQDYSEILFSNHESGFLPIISPEP